MITYCVDFYLFVYSCDEGWIGEDCDNPVTTLPLYLYDTFSAPLVNSQLWTKVIGAKVKRPCQVLAAGNALHFQEVCECRVKPCCVDLR